MFGLMMLDKLFGSAMASVKIHGNCEDIWTDDARFLIAVVNGAIKSG